MSAILPGLDYDEEALVAFCKHWGVKELGVFGSAARNELRPDSDVDLMAKFDRASHTSLWDVAQMREELTAIFGRRVDLVTPSVLSNPYRKRSIEKDLTVVYAA